MRSGYPLKPDEKATTVVQALESETGVDGTEAKCLALPRYGARSRMTFLE